MSVCVTRDIRVYVEAHYVPDHSNPDEGSYFFAYHITITNEGLRPVQLLRRHWFITNAEGHVEEVEGEGVVGKKPRLESGESFEYTSFCPLTTSVGTMHGTYLFVYPDSHEQFRAEIAPFRLAQQDLLLN